MDLDLGSFTVIVGPSSSGKSALMRACRALASNVRGSGVITRGQKQLAITGITDTAKITLERSETLSAYRIASAGNEVTFTKLAGAVPDQVTQALRIQPVPSNGASVNFASQFDRPFLLDDTGASVARTLGALTNVTAIFEAVRQANKIRLAASSKLKVRQSDLEQVTAKLATFQGLRARITAMQQAEQLHEQVIELQAARDRLIRAVAAVQQAEQAASEVNNVPDVPDITPVLDRYGRYQSLILLLRQIVQAETVIGEQKKVITAAESTVMTCERERQSRLTEAKICPTCGQAVTAADADSAFRVRTE